MFDNGSTDGPAEAFFPMDFFSFRSWKPSLSSPVQSVQTRLTAHSNVLHICDYHGDYDDLTPFLDYPGHVVNCSLKIGEGITSPKEVSEMFDRPFMGGIDRTKLSNTGSQRQVEEHATAILDDAPEKFILGASCTLSSVIDWKNIKTAVDVAHNFKT